MNRIEKVSKWKFGFFLVWQEGRESRWLKSMSAQGWQYIDNMGGWQYFRIDADKAAGAQIYTDMDSLKAKYRRVLAFLCLSGFPLAMMFMTGSLDRLVENNSPLIYPIAAIMAMLLYAIFRLTIMLLRKQ